MACSRHAKTGHLFLQQMRGATQISGKLEARRPSQARSLTSDHHVRKIGILPVSADTLPACRRAGKDCHCGRSADQKRRSTGALQKARARSVISPSRGVLECGGAPPLFGKRMRPAKHEVSATSCLTVSTILIFFVIFCKISPSHQRPVRGSRRPRPLQ